MRNRIIERYEQPLRNIDPRLNLAEDFGVFAIFMVALIDNHFRSLDLLRFTDRGDLELWLYELDEMDSSEQEEEIAYLIARAKAIFAHPSSQN